MKMHKQNGSLLLEVLISVMILAIGILALGKLQAQLVKGNSLSNQKIEATNLAQIKIEEFKGFRHRSRIYGNRIWFA